MKIAIIMSGQAFEAGGGVRMQGLMWAEGLRKLGHHIELINFWSSYNWSDFDIAIVLQFGGLFNAIIESLKKYNLKIVIAPIIDPHRNQFSYRLLCRWIKCDILKLHSSYNYLYSGCQNADLCLVRSKYESRYLSYCCDVDSKKIQIIPLSVRFAGLPEFPQKENICFHASRLFSPNKNVSRLISAAKKYGFRLVLAGYLNGEKEKGWLYKQIENASNIEYVGALSDDELKRYYRVAKVFALPSLNEGVGMVAMEAAGYGCEIVLTDRGAPKEYWKGRAYLVNPYSVDSIGQAILSCLENGYSQPLLMDYIKENYSLDKCSRMLEGAISKLLR